MERWHGRRENCKKLFAEMIGAEVEEVALLPNATTGINTAFMMLPLKKGDNVVTTDLCFPMHAAVVNTQKGKGVEPRFIRNVNGIVETETFEKKVDDSTAAVLVSQAEWANGFLHDLRAVSEIAHEHGAHLIVDGTQSVGGVDWDVKKEGVDFLAASAYKWLMGGVRGQYAGFFYVSSRCVDIFQSRLVGGQTLKPEYRRMFSVGRESIDERFDIENFEPRKGMRQFELFHISDAAYAAVENSMRVLLEHGKENVAEHVRRLSSKLIEGLLEVGYELQTPVEEKRRLFLNVKMRRRAEDVWNELYRNRVHVSPRVGGLRVSPHFYNRGEEIGLFIDKLNALAK
jgi:selenocysteine lyase/cysteine desulfurase